MNTAKYFLCNKIQFVSKESDIGKKRKERLRHLNKMAPGEPDKGK